MRELVGVYFSGTGNTKHCVERLVKGLDENAVCVSIEDEMALDYISEAQTIVFGYSIQFSNLPYFVREYIVTNSHLWNKKKIMCLATMGLFSGDGAGCAARIFKKYGADIIGGIHLRMPDCIGDEKALKKSLEDNQKLIRAADAKLDQYIVEIKREKYPREGLGPLYHMAGLFGQRLWFYGKTTGYTNRATIDATKCQKCGICVQNCPTQNLCMTENGPVTSSRCTSCYRCLSKCPQKAITILGKEVHEQCSYEKYARGM